MRANTRLDAFRKTKVDNFYSAVFEKFKLSCCSVWSWAF